MSVTHTVESFRSSIIVVGNFNPAIFTPDWLEKNRLIGEGDANAAREEPEPRQMIVSKQVATFYTEWFSLQVVDDRFSLASEGALSPAFRDLAAGIFQLITHTPVIAVGLNFMGHFKIASKDDYHRVGDNLVPKKIWNSLYPGDSAGLAQLTILIQQGERGEAQKIKDQKRITVEPSIRIKPGYGICLSYNDHHDVSSAENYIRPAERVATIIDDQWESSWRDAERVFNSVLSSALEETG